MVTPVSAIVDYASLQNAIGDYLIRDDLAVQIPLYISLAETEFNRTIRNRNMEVRATTPTVAGTDYYPLPSDWQEQRNIVLVNTRRKGLRFQTVQQMDVQSTTINTTGCPIWFTVYGNSLRLLPVPDAVYTLELFYYASIPPLAASSTNWLIQENPDIYLFGSLIQAALHLDERGQLTEWQGLYGLAMASLNDEEIRDRWSASPLEPSSGRWTP